MIETHIGFTGAREGMTEPQINTLYEILNPYSGWFHHGDCVGSDAIAHEIARRCGFQIHIHPPTTARFRAFCRGDKADPTAHYGPRNQAIILASSLLIATPKSDVARRSGTWSTIRYAKIKSKPFIIIWPDGSQSHEPDTIASSGFV